MTNVALSIALTLLALLAVFQIALICGAPLGRFAWGGTHRVLPRRLRIGSAVSVVLYIAFAALLLSRSDVLPGGDGIIVMILTWVLFAYFVLGIGMNAVSRSRPERWTMTPLCVVLAVAVLVIAIS